MMRIFFVIGVPETFKNNSQNEAYQQQLSDELKYNGDLLIVDVADGYMNLTYKMLALFDFVLTAPECAPERAPQLSYVFKGSDDIYVNPNRFLMQLTDNDYLLNKPTVLFVSGAPLYNIGVYMYTNL